MSTSATKPRNEGALDVWSIIHLFWENLWIILFCALTVTALTVFTVLRRPAEFVSTAVLEVSETPRTYVDVEKIDGTDLNSATLLKTIEQTVASQAVLRNILVSMDLANDPTFAPDGPAAYTDTQLLELLQAKVSAQLIRGTRLIQVTARDHDPVQAQKLAQAVIDGFFARQLTLRREDTTSAHTFLLSEAKRLEQEVGAAEERLQAYQEKNQAVSLADQHNTVTQRLTDLGQQVTAARAQRLALETDQAQVAVLMARGPRDLLNLRSIAALPEVVELQKQLNPQISQVAALSKRYREQHPTMEQATLQLRETQNSLDRTLTNSGNAIVQAYQAAQTNEQALIRELKQQEVLAMDLSRLAIAYRALEREAGSTDALYQQVLARLKTTDLSKSLVSLNAQEGNRIHLVAQPMIPSEASGISGKVVLIMSLLGGAGLGVIIVVIRRVLDTSLRCVDDAENFLGAPSLAAVPRSSLREGNQGLVINSHPGTVEAEAFRSLRTSLSFLLPEESLRVVMFTSAAVGEGKSYCSANYAASLAQQGRRTLLIDADLRRSALRGRYSEPMGPGADLSDCLRDTRHFPDAVRPTSTPNLFVLGDLRGSVTGGELLAGPNLKQLIELASEKFDRVVIDTAPVTVVGDTLHIAPHATAICLVVRAGRTPRRLIRRACILLGRPPAGIVMNQIKRGRIASYYYYSHGEDYLKAAKTAAAAG